jgi:cytochrome P450
MSMTDPGTERRRPVNFDHHRPVAERDPDDAYAELRASCPVAWTDAHGGYWVVTKAGDVGRVLKEYKTFSSAHNEWVPTGVVHLIPPYEMGRFVPEDLDPPEFHKYRRLLNGLLSPKHVAAMADRIEYWTTYFIDQFIEAGSCDFVYDLTSPLAGAVVLEWVGFPRSDQRRVSAAFHDAVAYPPDDERCQRAYSDLAWLDERIKEEIADRRAEPRDDPITYLVEQEIDGEPISDEMIEGMLRIIIGGGVDTTTSVMSSTIVHLARHPEHRQRLIENFDELWPTASEEFLRRYPPVRTHARTVIADTEVGGCAMRRGERVLASESSACHDEDVFDDPMTVVLDRFPNRHLAFGLGIHRCAGMHLARAEFREVIRQILARTPDYRIDETALERYHIEFQISGWISVTGTFTPGKRILPADSNTGG